MTAPWRRVVGIAGVVALVVVATACHASPARPKTVPLPRSMAAVGDSITEAYDVNSAGFLKDNPAESWSTGTDAAVDSQYQRILAAVPAIVGHGFNDAVSGSKMAALDGQLRQAASQQVDYVTVLMGANDLCTSSVTTMTPTATFSQQLSSALTDFFASDPRAHLLVASIPNLYNLWTTLHSNASAELVWGVGHLCQSMLAYGGTEADRQAVSLREIADNAALALVCGQFRNCRFDGGALNRQSFSESDISPVDYFHPSLLGQAKLAAVTWAAGYWPSTR
ncbi:MAG: GDSL-type esterase/lipase family protein [Acidimicrobiales bacterium]